MLQVKDIGYVYADTGRGCAGVSFDGRVGELTVLYGASGSGKSTALAAVAGILTADHGTALLDGEPLKVGSSALVLQSAQLFSSLSIWENVACAWGLPSPRTRARAVALLAKYGLDAEANSLPAQLSGGQRQRAALVSALAQDKPVVLADEPTSSLDHDNAQRVLELLQKATAQRVIVAASHDERLIAAAKNRVRIDGRIHG